MSDYETHLGTLRKIDLEGFSLEEKCKQLCEQHNVPYSKFYENYIELLTDMLDDWYIILNESLYRIEDTSTNNDFLCKIIDNGDGSYSYYAHFYNGGTCLKECLEDEFNYV